MQLQTKKVIRQLLVCFSNKKLLGGINKDTGKISWHKSLITGKS